MRRLLNLISCCACLLLLLSGCSTSKNIHPYKKFGAAALQKDYSIFRNVLEENHPSLYWYTSKDSLDRYFDEGYRQIPDSMTEQAFRTLLSYVIAKINCGHTTTRYSRAFSKYLDTARRRQFPLSIKLWEDTAVVYSNLLRNDTILKRGTLIKAINGKPIGFYRDSLFRFLSTDGYNLHHKYQTLSNRGSFGAWYQNVFGLDAVFSITYADSLNNEQTIIIPAYDPKKDTIVKKTAPAPKLTPKEKRRLRILPLNNVQVDTTGKIALLTVNSFVSGKGLRHFIRKTFRKLDQLQIKHLIVDVRNNGGGEVGNSTLLTKYIIDKKFKLADSLYAINKKSRYGKYIAHNMRNRFFMTMVSRKRKDGNYHFGYFERTYFKPKKKHHFDGPVYVLIGGNSFSATTLFANAIKGQSNVTLIGEETGGGAYGNTAWLIPEVTLPHTKVRFRLPLFRLVGNKDLPKTGRGIFPDIEIRPTQDDIKKGVDPKMLKVVELIRAANGKMPGGR